MKDRISEERWLAKERAMLDRLDVDRNRATPVGALEQVAEPKPKHNIASGAAGAEPKQEPKQEWPWGDDEF
jgi:hypothetical protein